MTTGDVQSPAMRSTSAKGVPWRQQRRMWCGRHWRQLECLRTNGPRPASFGAWDSQKRPQDLCVEIETKSRDRRRCQGAVVNARGVLLFIY